MCICDYLYIKSTFKCLPCVFLISSNISFFMLATIDMDKLFLIEITGKKNQTLTSLLVQYCLAKEAFTQQANYRHKKKDLWVTSVEGLKEQSNQGIHLKTWLTVSICCLLCFSVQVLHPDQVFSLAWPNPAGQRSAYMKFRNTNEKQLFQTFCFSTLTCRYLFWSFRTVVSNLFKWQAGRIQLQSDVGWVTSVACQWQKAFGSCMHIAVTSVPQLRGWEREIEAAWMQLPAVLGLRVAHSWKLPGPGTAPCCLALVQT